MEISRLISELKFKAVRSSGPGGQHVNKVSSKIEVTFDLERSAVFSEDQQLLLSKKLASKLTKDGVLMLTCDESRSQHRNKEIAIKKLIKLIKDSLIVPKKRKPTKPSKSAIRKRLNNKKKTAQKKENRRIPKKSDLD